MKDFIKIIDIIKCKNKISIRFDVSENLKKFFKEKNFWIDYDFEIDNVDDSILIVPFLVNVLPICWLTNSTIIGECIDKDFYESINKFKKGYVLMYPKLKFYDSKLHFNKIVDNSRKDIFTKAILFSGGVDAFTTLYSHIDEVPILITVWGADIDTNNYLAWNTMKNMTLNVGKKFKLSNQYIKSNFKEFLCTNELNKIIVDSNDKWWHGFQHGIGLIGLTAPLCYHFRIELLYIASSYTKNDKNITCASYPTIDENIKFNSVRVIHDQFELNRQEKINKIVTVSKQINKYPELHVCWENTTGINCCKCEKCCRTIIGLMIEKESPSRYGFDKYDGKYLKKRMIFYNKIDRILFPLWNDMINKFKASKSNNPYKSEIAWIEKINLNKQHLFMKKIFRKVDVFFEKIK